MAPKSKTEKNYIKFALEHPEGFITALPNAPEEGFEYFECDDYEGPGMLKNLYSNGFDHFKGMVRIFGKYMKSIMENRKKCFTMLNPYLKEIEEIGRVVNSYSMVDSYPNRELWDEIAKCSYERWGLRVGFTELPQEFIFKDKAVLFKYALVFVQEMDKEKIDMAPRLDAGEEVQRIYNSLGIAVNEIALYLRNKYNIKSQSNHPLGGLVNTTPLAAKAGLGALGHNGLLITPEFGQRVRIAPVFIENKIFEYSDHNEHKWISEFCKSCRRCEKKCPAGAIYSENVGTASIDREKCFPQFSKTLGCSICIKNCPFSKGEDVYNKLKSRTKYAS